jgi:hypothetical protein
MLRYAVVIERDEETGMALMRPICRDAAQRQIHMKRLLG